MLQGAVTLANGDQISFNVKCILLSIFTALFYWYAPSRNKWILLAILYFTYLAIAWYDWMFSCARNSLRPTFLYSFYGALKPRNYQEEYEKWKPETKRLVAIVDGSLLLLLLVLLPLFLAWKPSQC